VELSPYWAKEPADLLRQFRSSSAGLSQTDASQRQKQYGLNELKESSQLSWAEVLWSQLRSPLLLLLAFACVASLLSGEWMDAGVTLSIILASVAFGFVREYKAQSAIAALRARLHARATVVRDGRSQSIAPSELVPGDVVLLSAGSLIPADAVVLEANDCFVSEAVLTGESFPVEKRPGVVPALATLPARINCVYMGTNVRSGTARCLIVNTGRTTQFGAIAQRLALRPPEPEFERGLRRFGYLLTIAMLVMVLAIFAAHMLSGRPPVETLLFAVALAVGLSPELLPAILSVNLSRGAQTMAKQGVLVRHLSAIENLGSMDVLCTDKTGTLTEGVVQVEGAFDPAGGASQEVLRLAALNAQLETGLSNPLDDAILQAHQPDLTGCEKLGEIPFDFIRKRLSVVVREGSKTRLITKGAFAHVLEACTHTVSGGSLDTVATAELRRQFEAWSSHGIRVVAVAQREIDAREAYSREDEHDLTFTGFVTLLDRPKAGAAQAIADLARLGVAVKLITGDNRLVAQHIAQAVGMQEEDVLTGDDLDNLHDEALWQAAEKTELFVEVDPNQKERIILALKKMGHVVGFLGDGVNDAPAMHAADTSLSVEHAVDVARDAADFVLLEQNLDVIRLGIMEGRKTFANTLKYILTTTSANLGNMVSMALASLYLPFLPLLAGQILLNNFLSDIPAIGLANDAVDPEMVAQPRRWDMRFIARFMVEFGLMSSVFDLLTFGTLLVLFHATPEVFRTGWFVESLLTELVIALIVRTRRPFFQSRPGSTLLWSTVALIALALAFPYLPLVGYLGFVPIPFSLLLSLGAITCVYVVATEGAKRQLFRWAEQGK
jgi:P-type Mg2+ transporter